MLGHFINSTPWCAVKILIMILWCIKHNDPQGVVTLWHSGVVVVVLEGDTPFNSANAKISSDAGPIPHAEVTVYIIVVRACAVCCTRSCFSRLHSSMNATMLGQKRGCSILAGKQQTRLAPAMRCGHAQQQRVPQRACLAPASTHAASITAHSRNISRNGVVLAAIGNGNGANGNGAAAAGVVCVQQSNCSASSTCLDRSSCVR